MASSGSFKTSAYKGRYLLFSWTETSQNIANNTTTISWTLKGAGGDSGTYYYAQNIKVTIDGIVVYNRPKDQGQVQLWDGTTVTSGVHTFTHNADGTKSFSASAEAGIYEWAVNCKGSGSFTLDTIARASQPSCVTWPEHTQNVGEFGDTISIHMNRKSDAFKHYVYYQFGSKKGEIAKDVTTGTTWKIPEELMDLIPSSTSGSGTIYVDTYNGSTLVGTKYCGFTATVPASVKPSCSLTLEDIEGIDQTYGSPVQNLSRIKVTVNVTNAHKATTASCQINVNGQSYSGTTATSGLLSASGDSVVSATVKDSRGRTASDSYTMKVQPYSRPAVSSVTAKRCNEDGTLNKRGGYIIVTFSAEVSSMDSKNNAIYIVRYKKSKDTSYIVESLSEILNIYSVTNQTYIFPADIGSSYDVRLEVADRHTTTIVDSKGSTATSILSWRGFRTAIGIEDGLGIGKVPEKPNTLEIGWDTEFSGKVSGTIFDAIYPVGSIYLAYNHTDPGTLFPGTKWARIYGAFPWFTDGNGQIGLTGGERTVTLTEKQIPAHDHGGTYTNAGTARTHAWLASGGSAMGYDTVSAGGGEAHNNMPPYIQISAWRRTE